MCILVIMGISQQRFCQVFFFVVLAHNLSNQRTEVVYVAICEFLFALAFSMHDLCAYGIRSGGQTSGGLQIFGKSLGCRFYHVP